MSLNSFYKQSRSTTLTESFRSNVKENETEGGGEGGGGVSSELTQGGEEAMAGTPFKGLRKRK